MQRASLTMFLVIPMAIGSASIAKSGEPQVGHMVYFQLKDNSDKAKKELVAACDKLLSGHDGTVYYSAGVLAKDLKRSVNDRNWDVALHLVFKNRAAHDKYQDHPRHLRFIKENKENWKNVRVFDAYVFAGAKQSRLDRGTPERRDASASRRAYPAEASVASRHR